MVRRAEALEEQGRAPRTGGASAGEMP